MVKPMCAFLPQETPQNCNDWATVRETEESGETSFFFLKYLLPVSAAQKFCSGLYLCFMTPF